MYTKKGKPTTKGQPFKSFSWKLLFLIVLSSSTLTTIFTSISFYFDYTVEINLLGSSLKQIEKATVPILSNDLWNLNTDNINDHVNSIYNIKDIVGVWIEDGEGNIVMEKNKSASNQKYTLIEKYLLALSDEDDGDETEAANENMLGTLYVIASKKNMYSRLLNKMLLFFFTQGIKTFLASFIILFIFRYFIINHLDGIIKFITKPEFHNYHKDISLDLKRQQRDSMDELDILVNSINKMRSDITITTKKREEYLKAKEKMEKELSIMNKELDARVKQRTQELKKAQDELVSKAHKAGMADLAKTTLHTIGNIINSASISQQILLSNIKESASTNALKNLNTMLNSHPSYSDDYWTKQKTKQLVKLSTAISSNLLEEHELSCRHIERLGQLINKIISNLSSNHSIVLSEEDLLEKVELKEIISEAIQLNHDYLHNKNIKTIADITNIPTVIVQKYKFLNVFTQLFCNAAQAMENITNDTKSILIRVFGDDNEYAYVHVSDNGSGIDKENLEKIFFYGFTTIPQNEGIGLHMAANYMTEMHGGLKAESAGVGKGSTLIVKVKKA